MNMTELREQIDCIDKELVSLFEQRMSVSAQIADCKKERALPILDAAREHALLEKIAQISDPELEKYTVSLYQTILSLSRSYQQHIINGSTSAPHMEVHK